MDRDPNEEKDVELTLTSLEWEVVNQALSAPIRQVLQEWVRTNWPEVADCKLSAAWDSVKEKWADTW